MSESHVRGSGDSLKDVKKIIVTHPVDNHPADTHHDTGHVFNGGKGDDVLWGTSGADTLNGGDGNDVLDGGAGDDALNGGGGVNTAAYGDAGSGVTVSLAVTGAQDTHGAGVDTLTLIQNLTGSHFADVLTGSDGANVLSGGGGADVLNGGGGNDTLLGGDGADTLDGGAGNDVLNGGDGQNTASYADATAGVTVTLGVHGAQDTHGAGLDTLIQVQNLTGSDFNDTLTGDDGANVLTGGKGDDVLAGGGGNDTLVGGDGNDTLAGGAGSDTLTGGGGNDTFVFTQARDSMREHPDLITDFTAGDKIDLHAIDANTGMLEDQEFHVGGGGGHAGDMVVSFDAAHNRTSISLWTGDHDRVDSVIWLTGDHHDLTAADFIL